MYVEDRSPMSPDAEDEEDRYLLCSPKGMQQKKNAELT
jgi:hypothetical protein